MAATAVSPEANGCVYERVDSYPWDADEEFQGGLQAILGSNASPEQTSELTLRAQCFYYSRKAPVKFNVPVDFDQYKSWRQQNASPAPNGTGGLLTRSPPLPEPSGSSTATAPNVPSTAPSNAITETGASPAAGSAEQAPYPTSFAHIVDLITTGQPIPGIKEIPPTILEGQGTQSSTSRRKKPWEKDEQTEGLTMSNPPT
ncbi:hypothetical protein LTR16_006563 [Cryomyces antarcticus]|uniref:Uncharacterized protein n=1 Tax=Cryomyces antarcticus TaxID=329879 RepID=A0ABR0LLM7_9PEZI|nr:hypothetical protein LTR60_006954 [Cryomyces antarcticus]KAK5004763.1 hypothetical protein LTR39_006100 [Cryomyces antarcticus]KAK5197623.1 hypothetical protein LTR16_006563 [Cryomyces antarcticus]